ncbi:MAG: tripartite tricarboxylate transporter substrate binding protein [Rhodocyclaceae bacterium]|nr:tripartite tricarboxylate transporter substrate binding protein [Rhodocyclaceae bacterium]
MKAWFGSWLLPLLALLGACASQGAAAADKPYPARSVRLVLPFPAGGPSDLAARGFARSLERLTGQPVIVDNRPGGNGVIAARQVAAAAPDGHTLLWATSSTQAQLRLQAGAAAPAFVPVGSIGKFAFGMFVSPAQEANTVADFVAQARAHPGRLNVATSTLSEYKAAAQFMQASGIRMVRVPYKGAAQALPDLMQDRVQVNFLPLAAGLQYVRAGKLKLLATLQAKRGDSLPDTPTMAESGYGGLTPPGWQFLLAPPNTPRTLASRIAALAGQALQEPELRGQYAKQLLEVDSGGPDALAELMKNETAAWEQFFRDYDIRPDSN